MMPFNIRKFVSIYNSNH